MDHLKWESNVTNSDVSPSLADGLDECLLKRKKEKIERKISCVRHSQMGREATKDLLIVELNIDRERNKVTGK